MQTLTFKQTLNWIFFDKTLTPKAPIQQIPTQSSATISTQTTNTIPTITPPIIRDKATAEALFRGTLPL